MNCHKICIIHHFIERVTNFDNNDPTFFNSSENCVLAIFNDAGQLITDQERQFKPFSLTAEPV